MCLPNCGRAWPYVLVHAPGIQRRSVVLRLSLGGTTFPRASGQQAEHYPSLRLAQLHGRLQSTPITQRHGGSTLRAGRRGEPPSVLDTMRTHHKGDTMWFSRSGGRSDGITESGGFTSRSLTD